MISLIIIIQNLPIDQSKTYPVSGYLDIYQRAFLHSEIKPKLWFRWHKLKYQQKSKVYLSSNQAKRYLRLEFLVFLQYKSFYNMDAKFSMENSNTNSCTEEFPDLENSQNTSLKSKYTFWSEEEDRIYVSYIKRNKRIMEDCQSRKKHKVFSEMSKLIKTRTAKQIKSHHQKMMKQYHSLKDILTCYLQANITLKPIKIPQKTQQSALNEFQSKQVGQTLILEGFNCEEWESLLTFPSRNSQTGSLTLIDYEDYSPEIDCDQYAF